MSQQEKDPSMEELEAWARQMDEGFLRPSIEQNYVEITRLPKKINADSLRSLVISASRLRPKSSELCYKSQGGVIMEQVAIVEFSSQQEAYLAVERLRVSPFTKSWIFKVMMNPKFINPEAELMSKWLS